MSWVSQKERLYILRWYASQDITNEEMASDLGMSLFEFLEACTEVGLKPREEPDIYIPSQEEIAAACAEIRLGWDEETVEARLRPSSGSLFEDDSVDSEDHEDEPQTDCL